ncbi:MAG: DNAase [Gallionellales bacterium RIFCSPLOWO2_12_FULL_59_22]|nr:MAG: DNAase [Gallionellales bacterium RIFCSPLOWO2_02_FULL_59_110]OGT12218.1 MAG: DNAase [Gallionellales bacterium RIFCSPLOWO2_12_FULL_59_22]
MQFIDTHCHLDAAEFGGNQAALVQAAQTAGVGRIVVPAVARANFAAVRQLCERFPNCAPAYGIHPMYVENAQPEDLLALRACLAQPATVAVGEIGLDFFIEPHDRARQEFYFSIQLKLAREFELPVLLHIRRAQDIVLKHLRQNKVRGGIAHAFSGSRQQAEEFIKLGFKLGFGGAMTHSRATRLRELAATLPLGSIVLETDAPDIPPDFLQRGQPNKPEYLSRIAQTLAELRGISLQEIARITTENALSALPGLRPK